MSSVDHFERLGLPRRFTLSSEEIERRYLERSRDVHPDVHQLASTAEQFASLELSSVLNEANHVLRDPFRRADYLLRLEGGPEASEMKAMPPEFLEEMLEQRMAIEELKGQPPDSPAVVQMEADLAQRRAALLDSVGELFTQLDTTDDRETVLRSLRERLNALKYIQGLERDLADD